MLLNIRQLMDDTKCYVDEAVHRFAVAGMFNLRDVFELIYDTFNDGPFPQKELVDQRQQAVFHVLPQFGDELNAKRVKELFKQRLRNVAAIRNQLAKQADA